MKEVYFALNVFALAAGPLIYNFISNNEKIKNLFNYTIIISILTIVAIDIFPEAIEHAGVLESIIAAYIGFKLVTFLDLFIHSKKSHSIAIWIVVTGLSLHAITDGVALSCDTSWLPIAVILHQIPVGAGIWFVLQSKLQSVMMLVIITIATLVGFILGVEKFETVHDNSLLAIFQAAMSGSLLHIVLHRNNKIHKWWVKKHPSHSEHCDIEGL